MAPVKTWPELRKQALAGQEALVLWGLKQSGGNKTKAAELLRMDRAQLQRITRRLGI